MPLPIRKQNPVTLFNDLVSRSNNNIGSQVMPLESLTKQGCAVLSLFSSVQFSSVTQLCPTLCDPMSRSTPGLPVHHQFPEFTQTHVHQVSDAILPSHPLSSPSPPAPSPSQLRVFSNESTLCMRWPKYWSFSFSIIPSKEIPGLISLQSKGLSRVFSNTTVQKHQFFSAQPSSQSNSHIHT